MNLAQLRRLLLTLAVLFVLLALVWTKLVTHSFVSVGLADADSFTLTDTRTSNVIAKGTGSATYNLPTGNYLLAYQKNGVTADLQLIHISSLSWRKPQPAIQNSTQLYPRLAINTAAQTPVAFAGGYLYINSADRSVHERTANGSDTNISSKFNLSATSPSDSGNIVYNAVKNIYPVSNGSALVVTSLGLFLLNPGQQITKLPSINEVTATVDTSYDAANHMLYLVPASEDRVYSYPIANPASAPTLVFKTNRAINRVVASNGQVVVYYDNTVNTDPALLASFAAKKQIMPVIIDSKQKTSRAVPAIPAATLVSISPDGKTIAFKQRFSASLQLYDTATNKVTGELPAPDSTSITWLGSTLYFGRNNNLWSYKTQQRQLTLASTLGVHAAALYASGDSILAATNGQQVVRFQTNNSGFKPNSDSTTERSFDTSIYQYYLAGQ